MGKGSAEPVDRCSAKKIISFNLVKWLLTLVRKTGIRLTISMG
jgi:hypothetical protein